MKKLIFAILVAVVSIVSFVVVVTSVNKNVDFSLNEAQATYYRDAEGNLRDIDTNQPVNEDEAYSMSLTPSNCWVCDDTAGECETSDQCCIGVDPNC